MLSLIGRLGSGKFFFKLLNCVYSIVSQNFKLDRWNSYTCVKILISAQNFSKVLFPGMTKDL